MNLMYLLLGANLGDPLKQLHLAKIEIEERIGHLIKESSIYESEAWGIKDQPIFFNQILIIKTSLTAEMVLKNIMKIEEDLGRIRKNKWGSRLIDIDILYFNDDVFDSELLKIPHPYIPERNFTLVPLVEIAPNYVHPILKKTNQQLLDESEDTLHVSLRKT